jgi:hypothetical protein
MFLPFIAKADLTTDYNAQRNQLEQQILNIKTQYYGYIAGLQNSGNSLQAVQGEETIVVQLVKTVLEPLKS